MDADGLRWSLDRVDGLRMELLALLLEDPNPIHYDPAAVREMGMGDRVINQGPANMAFAANLVREHFPDGRILRLRTDLLGSVLEGDRVEVVGTERGRTTTDEGVVVTLEIAVTADGDRRVVAGEVDVLLPTNAIRTPSEEEHP